MQPHPTPHSVWPIGIALGNIFGGAIIVRPPPHPIGCHWGNWQMLPRDILASLSRNCRAQRSGPWVNLRQGEAEAGGWVPQVPTGSSSEVHPQSCGNQQPLTGVSSTFCLTSSPEHIHSFIIMFSFDLCLKCCFLPDLLFSSRFSLSACHAGTFAGFQLF